MSHEEKIAALQQKLDAERGHPANPDQQRNVARYRGLGDFTSFVRSAVGLPPTREENLKELRSTNLIDPDYDVTQSYDVTQTDPRLLKMMARQRAYQNKRKTGSGDKAGTPRPTAECLEERIAALVKANKERQQQDENDAKITGDIKKHVAQMAEKRQEKQKVADRMSAEDEATDEGKPELFRMYYKDKDGNGKRMRPIRGGVFPLALLGSLAMPAFQSIAGAIEGDQSLTPEDIEKEQMRQYTEANKNYRMGESYRRGDELLDEEGVEKNQYKNDFNKYKKYTEIKKQYDAEKNPTKQLPLRRALGIAEQDLKTIPRTKLNEFKNVMQAMDRKATQDKAYLANKSSFRGRGDQEVPSTRRPLQDEYEEVMPTPYSEDEEEEEEQGDTEALHFRISELVRLNNIQDEEENGISDEEQVEEELIAEIESEGLDYNTNERAELVALRQFLYNRLLPQYRREADQYRDEDGDIWGGGFLSDIFGPSSKYNNISTKTLKEYGGVKIRQLTATREKIWASIRLAMNLVSAGRFDEATKKLGYDDLYHIRLYAKLENGVLLLIEKNEVIYIKQADKIKGEPLPIKYKADSITLQQLMDGGQKFLGKNFFVYDAFNNNCASFVVGLLKGSNLWSKDDTQFLAQDVSELKSKLPGTSAVSNFVTSLGAIVSRIQGNGVKKEQLIF